MYIAVDLCTCVCTYTWTLWAGSAVRPPWWMLACWHVLPCFAIFCRGLPDGGTATVVCSFCSFRSVVCSFIRSFIHSFIHFVIHCTWAGGWAMTKSHDVVGTNVSTAQTYVPLSSPPGPGGIPPLPSLARLSAQCSPDQTLPARCLAAHRGGCLLSCPLPSLAPDDLGQGSARQARLQQGAQPSPAQQASQPSSRPEPVALRHHPPSTVHHPSIHPSHAETLIPAIVPVACPTRRNAPRRTYA